MEFRIINAYRDGDMKAHRREAKNTALIECVQVAAEKARWPLREEVKRMSSRKDGGGSRAAISPTPREPAPQRAAVSQQRTSYDRTPPATVHESPPAPPPPKPQAPAPSHGAARFSSVFGTRRR
jgi:CO/xanthine dehydrogenase Mo-binding subunit